MKFPFLKNPVVRFLVIVFALFILWYVVYDLWLHPNEKFDLFVVDITISASKWILESLGYVVYTGEDRLIGIDGASGLWVGDNCNGIILFSLFTWFIVAFKGKVKYKLFYIPLGILSIQLLNIIRVVVLAILDTQSRSWTEFNHSYTFNIIIYGYIFFLWMLWVNKYSEKE